MKLGAVEYITKGTDDLATFATARDVGLEGVEIMLTRQELLALGQERLHRLMEAKAQTGLEIPSFMLSEHNSVRGIGMAEPRLVDDALEDIRRAIDWAVALGAQALLVPFFGRAEIVSEEDLQRTALGFRSACALASDRGVSLCYEGTLPAAQVRRLAEMVDSPAFGVYFDVGNLVWRGMDTATEIRGTGDLIKLVHMKDARIGPSDCPMGLGRVDYTETAKALREIGYDGWIVGEFAPYPDDPSTPPPPPELVARDVSFIHYWFPELATSRAWPRLGAHTGYFVDFKRGEWDRMVRSFKEYDLTAAVLWGELLEEALQKPSIIPEVRQKLERNGIKVVALGGYRNLVSPDARARRQNIEHLKRCLELAPQFGTSLVATEAGSRCPEGAGVPSPDNRSEAAWQLLCEALDELLPVAAKHRSVLAMEGWVNTVLQHEGHLLRLLDKYRTDCLQLVLDPYNYMSKNLLPAAERMLSSFLNRFENRFVLAHLKDIGPGGAEDKHLEFGQGVFPQKPYLDFLRTRRPDLPIILEYLPFDHIPAAMRRLRESIAVA